MAVHPLRPATDRCLGRPLPYQLANQTRIHPFAIAFSEDVSKRQVYAKCCELNIPIVITAGPARYTANTVMDLSLIHI